MAKMVVTVFKIIICTILLAMAVTLSTCLIDVFVTINRLESVASYMKTDIASNNCLLYDSYKYMVSEVADISCKSSCLRAYAAKGSVSDGSLSAYLGTTFTYNGSTYKNAGNTTFAMIELDNSANIGTTYKNTTGIQLTKTKTGNTDRTATKVTNGTDFYVASYGTIMTLRINAEIRPSMWTMNGNLSDTGWVTRFGHVQLHLTYKIPALTYIKG